jgi:hypothetical protein
VGKVVLDVAQAGDDVNGMTFAGAEAHVAEVLALIAEESMACWLQLCLPCSFLLDLLLHDLGSLHYCPLFGHVLLHKLEALVLLVKACYLILYDDLDFLFRVLALEITSFSF